MNWKIVVIGLLVLVVLISGCIKQDEFCHPKKHIEECTDYLVQIEGIYPETAEITLVMDTLISKNNINPDRVKLIVDNLNILANIGFYDKVLVTGIVEEYEVEYIEYGKQKRTGIRVSTIEIIENECSDDSDCDYMNKGGLPPYYGRCINKTCKRFCGSGIIREC